MNNTMNTMALRCQNSVKNGFAFLRVFLLSFKGFCFPAIFFTFLQILLLSFSIYSNSFCFPSNIFYRFPSNIFFVFLQIFFAFLQIGFIAFLQIFFAFLQVFFLLSFKYIFLLSFKCFCFPSNILTLVQILLLSFKAFSLLSFFFKKIGMAKFYQLENQSIWNTVFTGPRRLWRIYQIILF